ncbi:MAG: lysophospholipid acyltransferase family protein [Anaerolineales bacterium]
MTATDRPKTTPKHASNGFYAAAKKIIGYMVAVLWRRDFVGTENFPAKGPYLVATNHLSAFDAPVMLLICPGRIRMFGADKWRSIPVWGRFIEAMGVIWVNRGTADLDAIKASLNVLKAGGLICVAPEGTRSPTGVMIEGKPGLAYLADRAKVPIVPVAMWGTEKVGAAWKRLRRPKVSCMVGEPIMLPSDGRAKGTKLDELTDLIMCRIAAMLPPEYRGVYADHPLLREMLQNAPAAASQV